MAGYTRNDTGNNIADGNVINAADLDGEFDSIQTAFNETSGHTHDGTVGEGAPISVVGPAQDINVTITEVVPKTTNTMSLGTAALQFKDLYIDGTANIDSLVADTADINAGTIDNAVIGGATPEAATFTTLTATDAVSLDDAVTINESAADVDFRVEGVGKPNALFVQGSDGNVGVNTNSPTTTLDVNGTVKASVLNVAGSSSLDGAVVVNETGADVDFRVESDTNSHALFVQGSNGAVGIGTSSPLSQLEVSDTDGATGINVTAYRNLTAYGNSYVQFNGPRFDTADQDAVIGRGAITLLGNAADTSSSMWISAATASLAPATATEANMQGYNAGLNITSDGELGFWDSGTERFTITSAGDVGIGTDSPASTLDVNGTITGTSLDMNGNADFSGNITLSQATSTTIKRTDNTGLFSLQGGTDALSTSLVMYGNAHATLSNWTILEADTMIFRTVDNTDFMRFIDGTGTIFNETGADLDFRIESDTNTHAFLLRGSDGYVGLGTSNPTSNLEVANISGAAGVEVTAYRNGTTYGNSYVQFNGPRSNTTDGNTNDGRGAITLLGNSSSNAGSLWINAASSTLLPETADEATMQGYQAGLNLNSDGELAFWDNGTQKFLINSSGDVGIGTSNPSAKLDVNGAAAINDTLLISRAAVAPKITFENSSYAGGDGGIGYFNSGALTFDTNAAERVRIDASGNVGIGTSSPQTNLNVDAGTKNYTGTAPNASSYAVYIESGATGTTGIALGAHNSIPTIQGMGSGTSYNLALCPANGSVGIGKTNPAQKLDVNGAIKGTGFATASTTNHINYMDQNVVWTPTFVSSGGGETISYTVNSGQYCRYGEWVTCTGRIVVASVSGGSGSTYIGGLPFTTVNASIAQGTLQVGTAISFVTNAPQAGGTLQNTVLCALKYFDGNQATSLSWSEIQAGSTLFFTIIYRAA